MLRYFLKINPIFISSLLVQPTRKMADMTRILANSAKINACIKEVEEELSEVENLLQGLETIRDLNASNLKLEQDVQRYKQELIRLETLNKIIQIPVPSLNSSSSTTVATPVVPSESSPPSAKTLPEPVKPSPSSTVEGKPVQETKSKKPAAQPQGNAEAKDSPQSDASSKPQKKQKQKSEKSADNKGGSTTEEPPVDVGRLDFRVGKIVDVKKHPDADSLYVEEIDVGQEKNLTVVSGLVKHVPIEEMQNRMVVIICNLKPAKMRGVTSEAMVMCASTPDKVEVLSPPEGSAPGDLVSVEGYPRLPDPVLNPKKKIFETVAPDLKTNSDKLATYKGSPWTVPGKGYVTAQSLINVNIK